MTTTQRTKRPPYDADHARIIEGPGQMTAYWGNGNPDEWEHIRTGQIEIIARARRVHAYDGAGWWGWIIEAGSDHYPLQRATKAVAKDHLRSEIADYFQRRSNT